MMRVPPHWTAEQASLFTDFLGHVLQAIWDEHDDAIVGLIVEHGGIRGGCRCRVCSAGGADEDGGPDDPAGDEDGGDDIPF